jgi:hypothetical protein
MPGTDKPVSMTARTIIVVRVSVDHTREREFNEFYHHRYLPSVLRTVPEINAAWRYTEHNVDGSLRYYIKEDLTIYSCAEGVSGEEVLLALQDRPGREAEKEEWASWESHFRVHEKATVYQQRYQHPRCALDGPFGSKPFFMVSVEVREEEEKTFNTWYESDYLPCNLSDVPTWVGCRRYCSRGRSTPRTLTIYEAADLAGLATSLESMRAPHRLGENASWKKWDTGKSPVITWEDAASYRPIFRYP